MLYSVTLAQLWQILLKYMNRTKHIDLSVMFCDHITVRSKIKTHDGSWHLGHLKQNQIIACELTN
jgi:predicted metalloenzyme YecM